MQTMNIAQAAKYLGTTRQKINRMIGKGKLIAEVDPMDERQKLITVEQLDRIKQFKEEYPLVEPAPSPLPVEPAQPEQETETTPVKRKFTGQAKDYAWELTDELGLTISQVKNYMMKNPSLIDLPYSELKKAVAEKFKRA